MIRYQRGVTIVESMVAVVILGVGLVGVLLMQGRAYGALSDAASRTEAALAADKLVGIMTTDQGNLSDYALAEGGTPSAKLADWYADTGAEIPDAAIRIEVDPVAGSTRSQIDVVISWPRRGQAAGTAHCSTTNAANPACHTHAVTAYIAQSK